MVSRLEDTGAVPAKLASKRGSLKKELLMQGRNIEVRRNNEAMVQRKTGDYAIQERYGQMVVQRQEGQDNKVICDNRNILRDSSSDKGSEAAAVMKKPPLLKRRPALRENQVQEIKEMKRAMELKGVKGLRVTKALPEEVVSVGPAKLEEKPAVKQRMDRYLYYTSNSEGYIVSFECLSGL